MGRCLFLQGTLGEPTWFDEFAGSEFGQAQAGPAVQREGVRPTDGPSNPTFLRQ